jgi:dinuclear metal center YbgI/SA1388 family protein
MLARNELMSFLDGILQPHTFKDACPNGLQVYGQEQVARVACCTSVSEDFFQEAKKSGAETLLVHHGLFWEGSSRVVDPIMAARMRTLLESDINLIAYHLPLDAHQQYGNNAQLAHLITSNQPDFSFGHYKGTPIGCLVDLDQPRPLSDLAQELGKKLSAEPYVLEAGSQTAKRVGVVSGGAGDIPLILEAMQTGCDTFVTGVLFEQTVAFAKEAKVNVVALGHYNSEKLGVKALGDLLAEKHDLEVIHLDIPNVI